MIKRKTVNVLNNNDLYQIQHTRRNKTFRKPIVLKMLNVSVQHLSLYHIQTPDSLDRAHLLWPIEWCPLTKCFLMLYSCVKGKNYHAINPVLCTTLPDINIPP